MDVNGSSNSVLISFSDFDRWLTVCFGLHLRQYSRWPLSRSILRTLLTTPQSKQA